MDKIKRKIWELIKEIRDFFRDADRCWEISSEESKIFEDLKDRLYDIVFDVVNDNSKNFILPVREVEARAWTDIETGEILVKLTQDVVLIPWKEQK